MSQLGIINNVQAGRTRARLSHVRELIRATGALSRDVEDLPSIESAMTELLAAGVEILAINGGDGTAQAVLSALPAHTDKAPDIAILPGGTTNLTAHDLSGRQRLGQAFQGLAAQAALAPTARRYTSRSLLEVEYDEAGTQRGFFLGAGAILAGMEHFRTRVGAKGLRDELAAGISLLRGLAGIAGGEHAWSAHETRVTDTASPGFEGRQNLVLATSLERLLLGLRPWWGNEAAPLHLTSIAHDPQRFLRVMPALLRGRPHALATQQNGYCSANVESFVLEAQEGFALDGQIFRPGGPVRVRATSPQAFLCLEPVRN